MADLDDVFGSLATSLLTEKDGLNKSSSSLSTTSSSIQVSTTESSTTTARSTGNRRTRGRQTTLDTHNTSSSTLPNYDIIEIDEDGFSSYRNTKGNEKKKKIKTSHKDNDNDSYDENEDIIQAARKRGMDVKEYAVWRANKQINRENENIDALVAYIKRQQNPQSQQPRTSPSSTGSGNIPNEGFHGLTDDEEETKLPTEESPSALMRKITGRPNKKRHNYIDNEELLILNNPALQEYSNIQYKLQQRSKEILDGIKHAQSGEIDPSLLYPPQQTTPSRNPNNQTTSLSSSTTAPGTTAPPTDTEKHTVAFIGAPGSGMDRVLFRIKLSMKINKVLPSLRTTWNFLKEEEFNNLKFIINGTTVKLDDTFGKFYDPDEVAEQEDDGTDGPPRIYTIDCILPAAK